MRRKCKDCANKEAAKGRTICYACRSRRYKLKNPFRYFYNSHRQNAKKRCIPWQLTFEEFKHLWLQSGKWNQKRYRTSLSDVTYSIHRKNVNEGYHINNVEIIPVTLNVETWWKHDRWQVDFRWRKRWSIRNSKPIEDCPF